MKEAGTPASWRRVNRTSSWCHRLCILHVNTVSGPTVSGPAVSGPAVSGPTVSGPTVSGPTVSGPTVSGPTVSGPTVSGPTVSGPTVSGPTVSGPTVSGPTQLLSGCSGAWMAYRGQCGSKIAAVPVGPRSGGLHSPLEGGVIVLL
ncbi:hypothetical protein NHX12_027124 [Muraenolepis orangiensis]|uniref:Uncharacterized protein n=1 Tax=Muraenolepis orangiensis TaxID=630683 RepID=A0A9Q0ECZ9_9TELE|nr:hypothetical protein NHX12_027124 [Muraenolepis orangiensis]